MSSWSLYLVRCADRSLYTGITNDLEARFHEHATGGPRAAKYLRGRGPLELVFSAEVGDRALASRLEWRVKRLNKVQKERLVREGPSALVARYPAELAEIG